MQKTFLLTLCLLSLWLQSAAQAPLFSYNLYRYNPAAAATSSEYAATMDYNSYMPYVYGFGNAMNLNVEKRFAKFHSAVGLNTHAVTWGQGVVLRRDANLSYSYQWALSKKENSPILAFGAESGLSYRISGVEGGYPFTYRYALYPNLNAGIHFYLPNQKFYASAVMRDILPSRNGFEYLSTYQFMSGYRFKIGQKLFLQPNISMTLMRKYYQRTDFYYPIDANLQLQHKKWEAGLSYSQQNFMGINAGVCMAKRFYLRGSYNYITSALNQYRGIYNITLMLAYRSLK